MESHILTNKGIRSIKNSLLLLKECVWLEEDILFLIYMTLCLCELLGSLRKPIL
jgi:hypothetical protein